jgi:post-segregation antitoxin (ccd killing protein)
MVKKFNLSVPDDLAEKIDQRRDYLGSLSAVFQKAVAEKIKAKEEFEQRLEGDAEMAQIIERLGKEKAALQGNYLEKGREEGLKWGKAASYKELEYARRFNPVDKDGLYVPSIPLHDDILGHYFIDALFPDELTNPGMDENELNEFAKQWLKGWLEAVADFWAHVEPKL